VKSKTIQAIFLLLIVVAAKALGQKPVLPAANNDVVPIFALLGSESDSSVSIDPILLIDAQHIRSVPDPCTEAPALHDFQNRYLKPGATYPIVFGGMQRGTASVTKLVANEWRVRLDSDVRIHGMTMALAVGSAALVAQGGSRRDLTAIEQKHVERAAREILTSQGVPTESLTRLRLTQVTATEVNHSQKLIASVEIERADKLNMDYSLFFVLDPLSDKKSVVWFQHTKGETDAEAVYLIDLLLAEHSGDRMIVRRVFYENYRYEVYKSREGRWIREFTSEVFGCL
jgi:hypothetical protein